MLFNRFLPFISGETLAAKSEGRDGEVQNEATEEGERSGGKSAEASITSASPNSATTTLTFVLASLVAVVTISIYA